jgi:hypothetical protein
MDQSSIESKQEDERPEEDPFVSFLMSIPKLRSKMMKQKEKDNSM